MLAVTFKPKKWVLKASNKDNKTLAIANAVAFVLVFSRSKESNMGFRFMRYMRQAGATRSEIIALAESINDYKQGESHVQA